VDSSQNNQNPTAYSHVALRESATSDTHSDPVQVGGANSPLTKIIQTSEFCETKFNPV